MWILFDSQTLHYVQTYCIKSRPGKAANARLPMYDEERYTAGAHTTDGLSTEIRYLHRVLTGGIQALDVSKGGGCKLIRCGRSRDKADNRHVQLLFFTIVSSRR